MNSIVTDKFKQDLLLSLANQVKTDYNNPYYIAVGRSEQWNVLDSAEAPVETILTENEFRKSMQSVIRVNAASLVVKKYSWTSRIYAQYDDTKSISDYETDGKPFYVINEDYGVYICLRTGRDDSGNEVASTVQPVFANNDPFELSDGYVWKFLYTVSHLRSTLYMSKYYMPVQTIDAVDSNSIGIDLKQYEIQNAARPLMITSFVVDSGGLDYSNPQLKLNGSVASPSFVDFTLDSSGVIKKIEYTPDSSTLSYVSDLKGALCEIIDSTGTGCSFRPILSSNRGIGANAIQDLRSGSLMFNAKIAGDNEDFILLQDYRQIAIMRGIKDSANGTLFNDLNAKTLISMTLASSSVSMTKDRVIEGAVSGARAIVDDVSNDDLTVWYHQNDSTGYISFTDGENVTEVNGFGAGIIQTAYVPPEVDPWSGDVLYIHNRAPVERVANQTEDIKIVIELSACSI
jgi:hypothetical protein